MYMRIYTFCKLLFCRQRIPRRLIFCHRSVVHRGRKIVSIAFAFDKEEDVYQFAAAAPYSYSRLQKHLAIWEKKAQAFATRESIAQTTVRYEHFFMYFTT